MFNDPVQLQALMNFSFLSSSKQIQQVLSFSIVSVFSGVSSTKVTFR